MISPSVLSYISNYKCNTGVLEKFRTGTLHKGLKAKEVVDTEKIK